jgi:hypothetical protein
VAKRLYLTDAKDDDDNRGTFTGLVTNLATNVQAFVSAFHCVDAASKYERTRVPLTGHQRIHTFRCNASSEINNFLTVRFKPVSSESLLEVAHVSYSDTDDICMLTSISTTSTPKEQPQTQSLNSFPVSSKICSPHALDISSGSKGLVFTSSGLLSDSLFVYFYFILFPGPVPVSFVSFEEAVSCYADQITFVCTSPNGGWLEADHSYSTVTPLKHGDSGSCVFAFSEEDHLYYPIGIFAGTVDGNGPEFACVLADSLEHATGLSIGQCSETWGFALV